MSETTLLMSASYFDEWEFGEDDVGMFEEPIRKILDSNVRHLLTETSADINERDGKLFVRVTDKVDYDGLFEINLSALVENDVRMEFMDERVATALRKLADLANDAVKRGWPDGDPRSPDYQKREG